MTVSLMEKFQAWDASQNDPDLENGSLALVLYLANKLYGEYEPDGLQPFMVRLDKWLDNVKSEADQKVLVSLLSHVFFAGRGEFESLYRSTLTNVYRWIADVTATDISDVDLVGTLNAKLRKTWICPITDSLRINSFLKVNGITGHDHRPHWRSLEKFGDVAKINQYIRDNSIERLVLIEDFVGSGSQIVSTIDFACANFGGLQIALCPLIICPEGNKTLLDRERKHNALTYLPTMVLPEEVFLGPAVQPNEPPTFARARTLLLRIKQQFISQTFGYKDTGALVVLFSNCPDNTLAAFRDEAVTWNPLFPRVRRPE